MTDKLTITVEHRPPPPQANVWIERALEGIAAATDDTPRIGYVMRNILHRAMRCEVLDIIATAAALGVTDDEIVRALVIMRHAGWLTFQQIPRTGAVFVSVLYDAPPSEVRQ